jgi:S1-C subfamily serine protease
MRLATLIIACCLATAGTLHAQQPDPRVMQAEARRVAAIDKVRPSVVAIFSPGGAGGGSGVLIDADGYALTNFHVVEGSGPVMKCGLPDGYFYDGVLVGLDKVGDVALIKLLPRREGQKFPFAALGDSDKLRAGDWSLAMGNPFLLATDFTPTVTFGLISGVHRYQYPAGTLLEYTDCIQIDTSINPGNSGGPLFNMDGELIGINGRGSFEKRGRVNSGVGYAISINQIKNFMGHLRAGLDSDHATLGAIVESAKGEDTGNKLTITRMLEECDAYRRGLQPDDELVSFAGRQMNTVNQFKNVLGIFPKGWRVPLTYRRENAKKEILVRLMGVQQRELIDPNAPRPDPQPRPPGPGQRPNKPVPDSPAKKLYEAKAGYANFYFNKLERDRLLAGFRKHGDFSSLAGNWTIDAAGSVRQNKSSSVQFMVGEDKVGSESRPVASMVLDKVEYKLEPLKKNQEIAVLKEPKGSGGLPVALYHYRLLLTVGEKAFEGGFSHGGNEPLYLPPKDELAPDYTKLRVDAEVLRTEHGSVPAKWYFSPKDQTLLGFEVFLDPNDDPCEVYLFDYRPENGRLLPHRMEVRYGNDKYGDLTIKSWQTPAAK